MTASEFAAQSAAHAALLAAAATREATLAADTIAAAAVQVAVCEAFTAGVAPKNIAKASGLSRTRIYEIRTEQMTSIPEQFQFQVVDATGEGVETIDIREVPRARQVALRDEAAQAGDTDAVATLDGGPDAGRR